MRAPRCLCLPAAILLLFTGATITRAAEQCHLKLSNAAGGNPSSPSQGADAGGDSGSATASSSATTGAPATSSPTPTLAPFDYSNDKIRGVNLGGWFVLEPWITPSLFEGTGNDDIIDEYTYGELQDYDVALRKLTRHWETFYTEDDFAQMQRAGINHVRIPVGYWSIPLTSSDTSFGTSPAPYIPGAWPYILQALNWAKSHSIYTIFDLHGAPGSQNGYDNSGQRTNNPQFAVTPANVSRALDTMRWVAENVGGMIDVLEVLNEGAGFRGEDWAQGIREYFEDGYDRVREVAPREMKMMIGDAFLGVSSWDGFMSDAYGVLMDWHEYQIFSNGELERSLEEHVQFACSYIPATTEYARNNFWTVVGEWSNAATDCAKWLNGYGIGARWDGTRVADDTKYFGSCANYTGSYEGFSEEYKTFLRRYWEVQTYVGEQVTGWIFWTWKAENADEWSYQKGLEGGWIPQDPTDRLYPNICS